MYRLLGFSMRPRYQEFIRACRKYTDLDRAFDRRRNTHCAENSLLYECLISQSYLVMNQVNISNDWSSSVASRRKPLLQIDVNNLAVLKERLHEYFLGLYRNYVPNRIR
jgi:hypothetical protein